MPNGSGPRGALLRAGSEEGADVPHRHARGVQDRFGARELGARVVQQVEGVERRVFAAEQAAARGLVGLARVGERDHDGEAVAGRGVGAGVGGADLAGEGGEGVWRHLGGWWVVDFGGG